MNKHYDVLIAGAGHGGANAALALRQQGFAGTIGLIGDEPELPYDRPPLSKDYLSGEKPWERIVFRTAEAWAEKAIELRLSQRVIAVNPAAHHVVTEEGVAIEYGKLIWAAGGAARRLTCEGGDLAGVHTVRNRADVERMLAELPSVDRVAVVGGGYIGLEAAAVLRKLGKEVTLLEAMDRVLARVAGEPLSRFYEKEHRAHGVDLRLCATVDRLVGQRGQLTAVHLAAGDELAVQMAVVGIGIVPAVHPLVAAGAEGCNGVRVDDQCRTSLPDVFAIGDCAEHSSPFAEGQFVRVESVQNASSQASIVAASVTGRSAPALAVPWFWSNQYDVKLQTVGLSIGYDDLVVRGDPDARSFSVIYLRGGAVIALDCVNAVRDYSHGRALVEARSRPDRVALADITIPLKTLVSTQ